MKIVAAYSGQGGRTRSARERSDEAAAPFAFPPASASLLRAPMSAAGFRAAGSGRALASGETAAIGETPGRDTASEAARRMSMATARGASQTGAPRDAGGSFVADRAAALIVARGSAHATAQLPEFDARIEPNPKMIASNGGRPSFEAERLPAHGASREAAARTTAEALRGRRSGGLGAAAALDGAITDANGTDAPRGERSGARGETLERIAASVSMQGNAPDSATAPTGERRNRRPDRLEANRAGSGGAGAEPPGRTPAAGIELSNIRSYAAFEAGAESFRGAIAMGKDRGEADARETARLALSPRANRDESRALQPPRTAALAYERTLSAPAAVEAAAGIASRPLHAPNGEPIRETDRPARSAHGLSAPRGGAPAIEQRAVAPAGETSDAAGERIVRETERSLIEQLQIMRENAVADGEVMLRLSPPELGDVRIRIQLDGKKVRAAFVVESPAVKEAIDGRAMQLSGALAREGFDLGRLDVSVGDGRAAKSWDDDGETGSGPLRAAAPARFFPPRIAAAAGGVNLFA